jgi:hypothetical protein
MKTKVGSLSISRLAERLLHVGEGHVMLSKHEGGRSPLPTGTATSNDTICAGNGEALAPSSETEERLR